MISADLLMLMAQCAPGIHPVTMQAVVRTESGGNPYAIGVVGGHLARQPRTLDEALATVDALARAGWNYSVGLAQVNRSHLADYGLTGAAAFDVCRNVQAGADILARCYARAVSRGHPGQVALRDGLSCYYSGNFQTGYRTGYVQRVVMSVAQASAPDRLPTVPAIEAREAIPVIPTREGTEPHARRPTGPVRTSSAGDANEADTHTPDAVSTPDNNAVVF
ncbi:lytic transglycosylase [Pandoraea cepalis]|uniref:Lytic transglycosylase n=1 Tax=Pandoraea cepalis TaxID=2508294 RepID=A0AAW7MGE5_9BURK|nr:MULTISPECIES: lytic transglycosylase domain-containing protein [Burkholderiaceae]MDN4571816.1 lytic transglycosylase [Pandoraea cepalis]MDN4576832.1 lytic transglycosylase [Pandoraea cepalis]